MADIHIIPTRIIGKIKPVHGIGQPPFYGTDYSLFHYLTDAHIPFSRLHDVGGWLGGGLYVDIPNLFRDFDADPSDPANYDFAFTDSLITGITKAGVEPFFRLGITIENRVDLRPYRVFPPKDNLQWAKICAGVIRHYTEGWADGFRYPIRYWEIWNEPENSPDPMKNPMWRGTKEQFFDLYDVASHYLKAQFPHLQIGGYASCGFYAITGNPEWAQSAAAVDPRVQYFVDFFHDFLAMVRERNCPLDFFSWHSYADVPTTMIHAAFVRKELDENGFADVPHFLNEWHFRPTLRGTALNTAHNTAMLLAMQNSSVDAGMFYDGRLGASVYGGLFDPMRRAPLPLYDGFRAFGDLYALGDQCALSGDGDGVYAVAAVGEGGGCAVIANTREESVPLTVRIADGRPIRTCGILTDGRRMEDAALPDTLPGYTVLQLTF